MSRPRSSVLSLAMGAIVALAVGPAFALGTDPGLSQQWGLTQIAAPQAWAGGSLVGRGVPIAIIDTGVDLSHPDLQGQVGAAVTCVNTRGDPAKCKVDGVDIEGHGTHVAGIAAAAANDIGVSGVAPGARIIAVRVFTQDSNGDFTAGSDDINAGIQWVIAHVPGPGVFNLSLGGDFVATNVFGASFSDGINKAWAAGWLPVLASGNENVLGLGSSNYGSLNALVVGATGPDGKLASYSSPTGSAKWAIAAPGGNASNCKDEPAKCVLSTYKGGEYALLQGTSMATPHAAGAAAVVMGAGLTNKATIDRLLSTANKGLSCGSSCAGRLDLGKAAEGLASSGGGATTVAPTSPPTTARATPTTTAAAVPSRTPSTTTRKASALQGATVTGPTTSTSVADASPTDQLLTMEPPGTTADGLTDLSIGEAAAATDRPDDGRSVPALLAVVAAFAVFASGGGAAVVARSTRRPVRSSAT